jgi:ABC-2 type transport system permease protein
MLRSVFTKTIRDGLRGYAWWVGGIAALVALTVSVYPSIRDNEDLNRAVEDYPEAVKAFVGGEIDFSTPSGYLNTELFSFMIPIILLVYAILAGSRAIAGEEEDGTLELLAAQPVSRALLVVEKFTALGAQLAILAAGIFLSVLVTAQLVDMGIGTGLVAAAALGVYVLAVAHGGVALLVGAATGSRSIASGAAASLAVAAYLLNGLGGLIDELEPWESCRPSTGSGSRSSTGSTPASSLWLHWRSPRSPWLCRSSTAATSQSDATGLCRS